MLLADVLSQFKDESFATESILRLGDITLLAQLRAEAEANGQSLGEYAQGAMRRYAAEADDDEWVSLLGALAGTQDPGSVCLQRAFAYVLKTAH
jgi:hypothetical protein